MKTNAMIGRCVFGVWMFALPGAAWAQVSPQQVSPQQVSPQQVSPQQGAPRQAGTAIHAQTPEYVLGPNDELTINALEAEEISNKPVRVSVGGDLTLPMVGRIHATGLTVQQLEKELVDRL